MQHQSHRTINLTARMRWTGQNAMKPRIQCVLTQWIPGFMAFRFWLSSGQGLV